MTEKRVLIIAFHYPPSRGSSGIQRTLKFSAYLREFGWEPMVLTVSPRAYEQVDDGQIAEIPPGMLVRRAFGLDAARHLALGGRYARFTAQPDRWVSWWPGAVLSGMQLIRRFRPAAIMSTSPIATAHLIGRTLQRLSGLPWVADFRDSMTEPGYPRDPVTWAYHRRLEEQVVRRCTKAVFTTEGTLQMYAERYPDLPVSLWEVIENGFDEENFREAEAGLGLAAPGGDGPMVLLHSGILYPEERDPRPLFAALRRLKLAGEIDSLALRITLRATGTDAHYTAMLAEHGIGDLVSVKPVVPYRAALQEMLQADGLLLMQGRICNHQIPAKLYEYARAGRPILALTDFAGNTAALLRRLGCSHIADIADADSICDVLKQFIADWKHGGLSGIERRLADGCSRRSRTGELARLLDQLPRHQSTP